MFFQKKKILVLLILSLIMTACSHQGTVDKKTESDNGIKAQASAQTNDGKEDSQTRERAKAEEAKAEDVKVEESLIEDSKLPAGISKTLVSWQSKDGQWYLRYSDGTEEILGEKTSSGMAKDEAGQTEEKKPKKSVKRVSANSDKTLVSWHKHGDHWHLLYSDGSEGYSDTEPVAPVSNKKAVFLKNKVEDPEISAVGKQEKTVSGEERVLVSWVQHGDHWHLLYSDGTEEVSYTDPATWQVTEKLTGLREKEQEKTEVKEMEVTKSKEDSRGESEKSGENPSSRKPGKSLVSWYKHGDHWHLKYSDGSEEISYTDPSSSGGNDKPIAEADNNKGNTGNSGNTGSSGNTDNSGSEDSGNQDDHRTVPEPSPSPIFEKVADHGDHIHVWVNGIEYVINRELYEEFIRENKFDEVRARGLTGLEYHEIKDKTLREEVEYIAKIYGVKLEAIRVSETYFSFNDPGHEYDPTHIHPLFVSRKLFYIPEVTGNAELDFENEMISVSHHTGIPVFALQVRDGRFVLPHGSHDHYVYIQSDGYEEFMKNKKPILSGPYVEGELNEELILGQVAQLKKQVEEKYEERVERRRVLRVLEEFEFHFHRLKSNSTVGYQNMLDRFRELYLSDSPVDTPIEEPETTDPEAEKLYQDIMNEMVNRSPQFFEKLKLNRDQFIKEVNEAVKDKAKLYELSYRLKEYIRFEGRSGRVGMGYVIYFLENMEKPNIMPSLREEIADALIQINGRGFNMFDFVSKLVELNIKLSKNSLLEKEYVLTDLQNYPQYHRFKNGGLEQTIRKFVSDVAGYEFPIELPVVEKLPKDLPEEAPQESGQPETPFDPEKPEPENPEEENPVKPENPSETENSSEDNFRGAESLSEEIEEINKPEDTLPEQSKAAELSQDIDGQAKPKAEIKPDTERK